MKAPVILALSLLTAVPAAAAPPSRRAEDVCLVDREYPSGPVLNTFVLQDVGPVAPTRSIALHGLFFTRTLKVAAIHGSAAVAADGTVRLGLFVHSSAASTNDFTLSGVTAPDFSGDLKFDADGDFRPDGSLSMERVDCSTITIP